MSKLSIGQQYRGCFSVSSFLAIFRENWLSGDVRCFQFCCSAFFFHCFQFTASRRLFVLCFCVSLSTLIRSGGLPKGLANSISIIDRHDPLPSPVVQYIERYGAHLDGHRLAAICLVGNAKEIRDVRISRLCNTAVGTCITLWCQRGGTSAMDSLCHYPETTSSFIKWLEEVGYERRVGDILGQLRALPFSLRTSLFVLFDRDFPSV